MTFQDYFDILDVPPDSPAWDLHSDDPGGRALTILMYVDLRTQAFFQALGRDDEDARYDLVLDALLDVLLPVAHCTCPRWQCALCQSVWSVMDGYEDWLWESTKT